MQKRIFTSESVTEGHPDKVCDQISDGVLDAILAQDPKARVACECCATTGMVMVMGEISTECYVDIPHVARDTICRIGYDKPESGFNGHTCAVLTAIDEQSGDIAMGVDKSLEAKESGDSALDNGAGDQGMMFGYACDETSTLMPMPIYLAQRMSERLAAVRKDGTLDYLRPDGKTQVSVRYEDGAPKWVEKVVVSTQHAEEAPYERLRADVVEQVVRPVLAGEGVALSPDAEILVNPTGRLVIGGPMGDCGLTGRKVIVDTYGGYARHGGGGAGHFVGAALHPRPARQPEPDKPGTASGAAGSVCPVGRLRPPHHRLGDEGGIRPLLHAGRLKHKRQRL